VDNNRFAFPLKLVHFITTVAAHSGMTGFIELLKGTHKPLPIAVRKFGRRFLF
jgi:hypothetical protein